MCGYRRWEIIVALIDVALDTDGTPHRRSLVQECSISKGIIYSFCNQISPGFQFLAIKTVAGGPLFRTSAKSSVSPEQHVARQDPHLQPGASGASALDSSIPGSDEWIWVRWDALAG